VKQPNIKIFGKTHKVVQIEFNDDGLIQKIIYKANQHNNRIVFRRDDMVDESLVRKYKIHEPTNHPYHNYAHAPDLESLLVQGEDTQ
jgi:hypothetical protein